VNKEHYLATISDSRSTLGVELKVTWGSGYVLPERQERYRGVIGLIPIGTQFTPVTRMNYIVEQTRVGQRTDYERLTLEVWSNGSVAPNEAVSQAAHILDKYFRIFFELGGGVFELPESEETDESEEVSNLPDSKIEDLDFSQRTFNCLKRAGLTNLKLLAKVSEGDLTAIRGFGKKSLVEVRDKLLEYGIEMKSIKSGYRHSDFEVDEVEEEELI
ncbi:MAG: DNA-directed RNA polymerase subunit alpha C-terminal domain-containing protein, partial [Rhabdochlamydiaceae bacterium]